LSIFPIGDRVMTGVSTHVMLFAMRTHLLVVVSVLVCGSCDPESDPACRDFEPGSIDSGAVATDASPGTDADCPQDCAPDALDALGGAGPGTWDSLVPLPIARTELSAAVVDGMLYVGGGRDPTDAAERFFAYDPVADSWDERAPHPLALHHAPMAAHAGLVFTLGGYLSPGFSPSGEVFAYDPMTDSWAPRAPMPEARGAGGAATIGDRIYVIGGVGPGNSLRAAVLIYDPIADDWSSGMDMPTPREHLAVATLDGLVYAAGGRMFSAASNSDVLEAYDPVANSWSSLSPMPTARGGIAGAALEVAGLLFVFGGESNALTFRASEAYDPGSDTWMAYAQMPTCRHGLAAAAIGGAVHIVAGGPTPGWTFSAHHEVLTP